MLYFFIVVCVTNAKQQGEPISQAVKYVVYVAIASLTVFYVGMTVSTNSYVVFAIYIICKSIVITNYAHFVSGAYLLPG